MTMADDATAAAMTNEATGSKEEDTPELQNEIQDAEKIAEAIDQDLFKNDDTQESSSVNAFVLGSNLSLSPSREQVQVEEENSNKEVEEKSGGFLVEDEDNAEDTPISPNAVSPPQRMSLVSEHSLMDDDDDDAEEEGNEEEPEKAEEPQKNDSDSPTSSSGRGAKILMNRFSSWRDKANETMNQAIKTNAPRFTRKAAEEVHSDVSDVSGQISASSSGGSSLSQGNEESVKTKEKHAAVAETTEEEYKETQRRTAVAVKVAASSVVDTVASGFRGRYSGGTAPTPEPAKETKQQVMTQSQTALIMQSRAKAHMQSILDSLEPQEYVMLLGNGMLGVNLKQAYLKNNGVYIDFLVEGGSAELSGVVCVGDNLMKVGDVDVFRRGLILNVPQTIAAAKRPVVLVLSTGQQISLERMNYIDVAVGMLHIIREEKNGRRDIASLPIHSQEDGPSAQGDASTESENAGDAETPAESPAAAAGDVATEEQVLDATVPTPSFDGMHPMNIPSPPLAFKEMVSPHVAKRYVSRRLACT